MKDHPSQRIHTGLSCRDVAEQATDYLEDRLPALTTIRVGLHLASCADCRAYVMQIGVVSSALRDLPKLYPSPINCLRLRQQFAAHHTN
jgi:predicted anti-sigma-YlaC factor YlaD